MLIMMRYLMYFHGFDVKGGTRLAPRRLRRVANLPVSRPPRYAPRHSYRLQHHVVVWVIRRKVKSEIAAGGQSRRRFTSASMRGSRASASGISSQDHLGTGPLTARPPKKSGAAMHESAGSLTSLLVDAAAHPPRRRQTRHWSGWLSSPCPLRCGRCQCLRVVRTAAELRRRALYRSTDPGVRRRDGTLL
jgi:hypothetical protein